MKVYMVCDYHSSKISAYGGRILHEDGTVIGWHTSSSLDFLRSDLKKKLDNPELYEIIDLTEQETPDRFKGVAR